MILFLLLLALPVAEIYVLIHVGARIGAMNTFFALLAIGVLGAGLAKSQGRYIFRNLQNTMARGQVPGSEVTQGMLVFLGGILFLIPGFVTDVIGLLLVLPGTRHLIALYLTRQMAKKMQTGQFRVFSGGPFGGGGAFGGGSGPWQRRGENLRRDHSTEESRDVTPKVIDVTPLSSQTSRPTSSSDEGDPETH